uniref:Metalloendopeptidase n=1 Tax=Hucho hucho TaxID=62062 RepID=A0A4W5MN38_9TELE
MAMNFGLMYLPLFPTLGIDRHDPLILFGDIAMETGIRNASPCTARDCKWPKSRNGVVPVYISSSYTLEERDIIIKGLISFHLSTCIQFVWWKQDQDYLYFHPGNGCWSYLGRRGGQQVISLQQCGCVHHVTVQHEVLHALGFHHEQNLSDRDNVTIVENNNLMTPYDYTSVMHYGKYAFSKDYGKLPTIIPKPDSNVQIGGARQMSRLDIVRFNRLYYCSFI